MAYSRKILQCTLALVIYAGIASSAQAISIVLPGDNATAPTCSMDEDMPIDVKKICKAFADLRLPCSPTVTELRHAYAINDTCYCEVFAADMSPTCGFGTAGTFTVKGCGFMTHQTCRQICTDAITHLNNPSMCKATPVLHPAPISDVLE